MDADKIREMLDDLGQAHNDIEAILNNLARKHSATVACETVEPASSISAVKVRVTVNTNLDDVQVKVQSPRFNLEMFGLTRRAK